MLKNPKRSNRLEGLSNRRRQGSGGVSRIPNQDYEATPAEIKKTRELARQVGIHDSVDILSLIPKDLNKKIESILGPFNETTAIALIREALQTVKLFRELHSVFESEAYSPGEKMKHGTQLGESVIASNTEAALSYLGPASSPFALLATGDLGRKEMQDFSKLEFGIVGSDEDFDRLKKIRALTRWKIQLANKIYSQTFLNPADIKHGQAPVVSFGSSSSFDAQDSLQSSLLKHSTGDARVFKSFSGTKSLSADRYAQSVTDIKTSGTNPGKQWKELDLFLKEYRPDFPPFSMKYDLDKSLYHFLIYSIQKLAQIHLLPSTNTLERISHMQRLSIIPQNTAKDLSEAFLILVNYRRICHSYYRSHNSTAFVLLKHGESMPAGNMPVFSGKDASLLAKICGDLTKFHKFLKKTLDEYASQTDLPT